MSATIRLRDSSDWTCCQKLLLLKNVKSYERCVIRPLPTIYVELAEVSSMMQQITRARIMSSGARGLLSLVKSGALRIKSGENVSHLAFNVWHGVNTKDPLSFLLRRLMCLKHGLHR